MMNFSYEIKNRNIIVTLGVEIDHHNAEEIRKKVDKLIEFNNIKILIFDFSRTQFMDSSGIGVIMGRYKNIKSMGGEVGLVNVNEHINRVLKLSGIYRLVKNYSNPNEAIEMLG